MRFLRKGEIKKTILVLSDLHLGAGAVFKEEKNPLEDFHYDKELVEFIEFYMSGEYANRDVELIINGDLFDLLAVPYVRYFDDQYWSENAALEKLQIILDSHREVIDALIKFSTHKKKKLVYIIGNHDAELILPKVKKYLKDLFTIDGKVKIKILVNDDEDYSPLKGVVLKHGHEYEKAHHFHPKKSILKDEEGTSFFVPPWGSYYVTKVINRFKNEKSHINAVRPIKKFIINGLIYDTLFTLRFIFSNIIYFVMVRFIYFYKQNLSWKRIGEHLSAELELFRDDESIIDDFFEKRKDIKILIVGHTHVPIFRGHGDGRYFINTGTWTKMYFLDFDRPLGAPTLTYAQIDAKKGARKTAKVQRHSSYDVALNVWKGKNQLPFCEF